MIEPLFIVSLMGNIIQLMDVSGKFIGTAKEILESPSGMTAKIATLYGKAQSSRDLSAQVDCFPP